MKMITAVIQPFMVTKVTHALEGIESFPGVTIDDVRGFGREKASHEHDEGHRPIDDLVEYVKKVRLQIVAKDEMVDAIVQSIVRVAHTGNRGDGKIFISTVEGALRIRTSETGDAAV